MLKSDGTYITTPRAAKTTIVNEDPEHPMRADGDIVVQASGRWSAKDGKLNLCPDSQSFAGQAKLTIPGAGQRIMPLPQPDSTGPMSLDYACSAGQFETRLAVPGIAQPMVTRYSKVGADLPGEEEE